MCPAAVVTTATTTIVSASAFAASTSAAATGTHTMEPFSCWFKPKKNETTTDARSHVQGVGRRDARRATLTRPRSRVPLLPLLPLLLPLPLLLLLLLLRVHILSSLFRAGLNRIITKLLLMRVAIFRWLIDETHAQRR